MTVSCGKPEGCVILISNCVFRAVVTAGEDNKWCSTLLVEEDKNDCMEELCILEAPAVPKTGWTNAITFSKVVACFGKILAHSIGVCLANVFMLVNQKRTNLKAGGRAALSTWLSAAVLLLFFFNSLFNCVMLVFKF